MLFWEYLNFQNRDQNNKGFKSKKEEKNQQIATERKYEFQSVCKWENHPGIKTSETLYHDESSLIEQFISVTFLGKAFYKW